MGIARLDLLAWGRASWSACEAVMICPTLSGRNRAGGRRERRPEGRRLSELEIFVEQVGREREAELGRVAAVEATDDQRGCRPDP